MSLEINALTVTYGSQVALSNIDLAVQPGDDASVTADPEMALLVLTDGKDRV